MKSCMVLCAALAFVLGATNFGIADIAIPGKPYKRPVRPQPQPQPRPVAATPTHPLTVKYDDNIKNAVLKIPRNLVNTAAKNGRVDATRPNHTIIAGIALSCAAASVLVWRRGGRNTRLVAVGIVSLSMIAGGMAYGDLLAPGSLLGGDDGPQLVGQSMQVIIELVDGKEITLSLPTAAMPGNEGSGPFDAPAPSSAPAPVGAPAPPESPAPPSSP